MPLALVFEKGWEYKRLVLEEIGELERMLREEVESKESEEI